MTLPGGGTWTYAYLTYAAHPAWIMPKDDPNSLTAMLQSITDDQGRKVNYDFTCSGVLRDIESNQTFNGSTRVSYQETDYTYDTSGQLTHYWLAEIKNTWHGSGGTTSTLVQNDYTYDNAGQRKTNKITNPDGSSRTETYGYDDVNRLTSVNYGDGQTQNYTFDAMSNRLSKTDVGGGINGTENYGYNNANMLLTRGSNSYSSDADGNTLTGGGRTNTWDSDNRLVQSVMNGNTCVYTYSADGQRHRAAITNGGTTTTTDYVLDNSMLVRERRNSANYATYLVGPRGPEYRRDDTTNPATVRWYLYDGLGSVLGEVDPNGNITATRKLDVYGSVRTSTGTSTSKQKFVGQLGHQSDDETGLIYMRARYMDPVTGRFISEDPARSGANWYTYCRNNPVTGAIAILRQKAEEEAAILEDPEQSLVRAYEGTDGSQDLVRAFEGGEIEGNPETLLRASSENEIVLEEEVVIEDQIAAQEAESAIGTGVNITIQGDQAEEQVNILGGM